MKVLAVDVVGRHVRLSFGQILMHSEDYSTVGNARRAGRSLAAAISDRPVVLRYELRGRGVVEVIR